jgi:transposase InsO family protein
MPWEERSRMSLRLEFVRLAEKGDPSLNEVCRRFGISRKTGYKWLRRYAEEGAAGLKDRSRRPHNIVFQVPSSQEAEIVALRNKHPAWGARKIRRKLQDAGATRVPATSTVTAVLHRNGLIDKDDPSTGKRWQRFEHPHPNCLWQMDFKGPVATSAGVCHPLTVLDDHSRFSLCIKALSDHRRLPVKQTLEEVFSLYGLPDRMLVDNGIPWRGGEYPLSRLTVWLIHLGIGVSHSRPYHPQTAGKDERFHRTLKRELISSRHWRDIPHLQEGFDVFRDEYNHERPHEALGLDVPASRYRVSPRSFPASLPPIEYDDGMDIRKVSQKGEVFFKGRIFIVSHALAGYQVGLKPTDDGLFDVLFCRETVSRINMREVS